MAHVHSHTHVHIKGGRRDIRAGIGYSSGPTKGDRSLTEAGPPDELIVSLLCVRRFEIVITAANGYKLATPKNSEYTWNKVQTLI